MPSPEWGDPGQTWVWLPPRDRRPAALAELACGAALADIVAALDRAHPDLRASARNREEDLDGWDDGDDDLETLQTPETTIARIWPAVVAYTVGLLTQEAERPRDRSPWHVLESFELDDWVAAVAPDNDTETDTLNSYHVESVLRDGILALREALDPHE